MSAVALLVPLGLLVGLTLGTLGAGGSILAVPALVLVGGLGARDATTASLVVVGTAALVGMVPHLRAGNVRLVPGLVFGAAGTGGSVGGALLSQHLPEGLLLAAFAVLLAAVGIGMLRDGAAPPEPRTPSGPARALRIAAAGTGVGFLTGLLGVGGGFVVVPALVLLLGFPMPAAVGTSLVVIGINAATALLTRLAAATVDWGLVGPFAVAAVLGVLGGSAVARRVPARQLSGAFAVVLLAVAAVTAAQAGRALL